MSDLEAWAMGLAKRHLDVPMFRANRWLHTQAVATRAKLVSPVCGADAELLVAAAWVHDIGYSPLLAETGFHPVDGALFLERLGADSRITSLVAHHSAACGEAGLRGLTGFYDLWTDVPGAVRDALWWADMTTGFTGKTVVFADRLTDIRRRWGASHTVTRAITNATDELQAAISRTVDRAEAQCLPVVV